MNDSRGSASTAPQRPPAAITRKWREEVAGGWRQWDSLAVLQACDAEPDQDAEEPFERAFWRGLAAFMNEGGDALAWLDQAWRGYDASALGKEASVTAHAALVIGLLDVGAMERLSDWLARVDPSQPIEVDTGLAALWLRLGVVSRVALGQVDTPAAARAATALQNELMPLQSALTPHERLLVAMVLIEYHFAVQRFEQFDNLANLVEMPLLFEAAAPVLRARWIFTYGLACYHTGNSDRAEKAWRRTLALTHECGLVNLQARVTLQLSRLLLDRGRVDEADAVIESQDMRWGSGRTAQLIDLQQLRARVQLLRGQPARALATLEEANRLAEAVALPPSEHGSRLTDLVQVYIGLDRLDDALALLTRMADEFSGRSAQVNSCLQHLLRSWMQRYADPAGSRSDLEHGLSLAQATRYIMFFRLVPTMAASVCAHALRAEVAPRFVEEVIRGRNLPAPADADVHWPWPLWLNMLGGFQMRRDGAVEPGSAKTQQKPLELLRLLACERTLAIGTDAAIAALWPDADDAAARKSFEMAVLRLRRLLGDATLLWVADGRVGLDVARASSDVQQRRRLIERIEALAMRATGQDTDQATLDECLVAIERVIALSHGELLPGMPSTPWLEAERQRCRSDTVRAALAAATVLERSRVGRAERELLETALRIEPLAESLVRRLMHAHERAGERGDALRVFESYRQLLVGRGATPGPQIELQWRALVATPR